MWYSAIGFIVTLTLSIVLAPLGAEAQRPAKVPRTGVLRPSGVSPCRPLEAFSLGLRELGYVEGQNIIIEVRCADGKPERQRELAVELVHLPVDILVAGAADGPLAAKQATSTIPIVFGVSGDPVAAGLVASLARPGGNVTGVVGMTGPEFHGKRLHLLLDVVPGVTRVAALRHAPYARAMPARALEHKAVEDAARSLGVHLQVLEVETPDDLEGAFAAMTREGARALFLFPATFFSTHRTRLLELAAKHRLPGIYEWRWFVEEGGLMSYSPSLDALWRRLAYYVDRILKGAKPADLPVEQPTTFELVINLKAAKALGLTIPPTLLFQADEVIQ